MSDSEFSVQHADHNITASQLSEIQNSLKKTVKDDGFFIREIKLKTKAPCELWGPAMGDPDVSEDEVFYASRGERPWMDRLVSMYSRDVDYVQAIGIKTGETFTLLTTYAGPLAPQNPEDPSNQDPKAAKDFWNVHALNVSIVNSPDEEE